MSPVFSPAAVKTLSSLFLPPELNILLGKDCFSDATSFLYAFIKSVLTLHDWKLPPLDVRNISILLTLQSQTAAGKMPRFFFIPKSRCLRGKTVFGSGASSYE